MKYIISENQMAVILAKVAAENSDESIAKVILNSIKKGQARIVDYSDNISMNDETQFGFHFHPNEKIIFTIGGLPIEINRFLVGSKGSTSFVYEIEIPFFGNKEIEVSDVLGEIIFELLLDQVKQK